MSFLRRRPHAPDVPEIVRLGREMASQDPQAFNVAQEALDDWTERFRGLAERAGRSDEGATRPSRMLIEAYAAASAAREAVKAHDTAEQIFNEQIAIAQEQTKAGVTKEWVVGFMHIRCIAIGYMLALVADRETAEAFKTAFWSLVHESEQGSAGSER